MSEQRVFLSRALTEGLPIDCGVYGWRGTMNFSLSLLWCPARRRWRVASGLGSASFQTQSSRAEKAVPLLWQSALESLFRRTAARDRAWDDIPAGVRRNR